MSEEKNSSDKNKLDRPSQQENSKPEAQTEETSLIRQTEVTPIRSPGSAEQTAYNYYNAPPDETPNLREYWRKIRKRKWLVLAITVIVTTIVTIESFRTKSIFEATATVALTNDKPAIFK